MNSLQATLHCLKWIGCFQASEGGKTVALAMWPKIRVARTKTLSSYWMLSISVLLSSCPCMILFPTWVGGQRYCDFWFPAECCDQHWGNQTWNQSKKRQETDFWPGRILWLQNFDSSGCLHVLRRHWFQGSSSIADHRYTFQKLPVLLRSPPNISNHWRINFSCVPTASFK